LIIINKMKEKESQSFINLGVVLDQQGRVLVIRRKKPEKGARGAILGWAFPGGKQRLSESRRACVEREVQAETGYQVEAVKAISMRVHPEFPVVVVYHLCRLKQPKPVSRPKEPWEVEEIRWVKPEEIKNLFTSNLDPKVAAELKI